MFQCIRHFHKNNKHINDNIGIIAKFSSKYVCSFLYCLDHMMLVNVKLDISTTGVHFMVTNLIGFLRCNFEWPARTKLTILIQVGNA